MMTTTMMLLLMLMLVHRIASTVTFNFLHLMMPAFRTETVARHADPRFQPTRNVPQRQSAERIVFRRRRRRRAGPIPCSDQSPFTAGLPVCLSILSSDLYKRRTGQMQQYGTPSYGTPSRRPANNPGYCSSGYDRLVEQRRQLCDSFTACRGFDTGNLYHA